MLTVAEILPRGNQYLVELRRGPAQTLGGIHLPDNWRDNWTDGKVCASGPGLPVGIGSRRWRSAMWAEVGDVALFQKHAFRPFGEGHRLGTVPDPELIAMIPKGTTEVQPLNDWVKIRQAPEVEAEGSIVYADVHRPRPCHGTIEAYGPGRFRGRGSLYGTRQSVFDLLGLPRDMTLEGLTVYWDQTCEVLACGREQLEFLLIKAGDLWGYEKEE